MDVHDRYLERRQGLVMDQSMQGGDAAHDGDEAGGDDVDRGHGKMVWYLHCREHAVETLDDEVGETVDDAYIPVGAQALPAPGGHDRVRDPARPPKRP
jgi:hypothetical protein